MHKIDQDFILVSENIEEIDDYAAQDLEIMNMYYGSNKAFLHSLKNNSHSFTENLI